MLLRVELTRKCLKKELISKRCPYPMIVGVRAFFYGEYPSKGDMTQVSPNFLKQSSAKRTG